MEIERLPSEKSRIINCHTHIFTSDHVPPYLGKTFLPLYLWKIFSVTFIVRVSRKWYRGGLKSKIFYFKKSKFYRLLFNSSWFIKRHEPTIWIANIVGIWLAFHAFLYLFQGVSTVITTAGKDEIEELENWLINRRIILPIFNGWAKLLILVTVLIFYPTGRNLILFGSKKIWRFLQALPGKNTFEYITRYINLGRFAIYSQQYLIYTRLKKQYPNGSAFVILPMDMEFMDAGALDYKFNYRRQMDGLVRLKKNHGNNIFPFVFIDPRRMSDPYFFDYKVVNGQVILQPCDVKFYIEEMKFSGFKIYPALGYYPFDDALLPLWRYAVQHNIPIMTHCITGTIFYRGKKLQEWNEHPYFEEVHSRRRKTKRGDIPIKYRKMKLNEQENKDFQRNFTHPLNYLCLLDEDQLKKVISEKSIEKCFYNDKNEFQSLQTLKICFGHFGGDEEWAKYFEYDRQDFAHQLTTRPTVGIQFFKTKEVSTPGKISQLWRNADWYSIICSMMLQYPNIYGDISYIIHNPEIVPLLKKTLSKENSRIRTRVLFGTDFYVVRNHKSERNMLAEIQAVLSEGEFDLIARTNPISYLNIKTLS